MPKRVRKAKKSQTTQFGYFAALKKLTICYSSMALQKSDAHHHGWMGPWQGKVKRCNTTCENALRNVLILKVSKHYIGDMRRGSGPARRPDGNSE
jgi:hypothetical protein